MKFAFCLFKYFPFGGLQRDFLRIAKECVRRGHKIDVFTMSWEGEYEPAIPVNIIPVTGKQNHVRAKQFVRQIQPKLQEYDRIIGFNKMPLLDVYYAADTCYQAKARQQRSFWYRLTPRYRHLIAYEKAVFGSESKTRILLLSKSQQSEFMHFYQKPADYFELLPPGIAKDRIAPINAMEIRNNIRNALALQKDAFLLLLVGSGFKTKGLDRVLYAYASLSDDLKKRAYIYVIGKDNPILFQRQAKKLGIAAKIKFLGGRHDVADFLLAADILLHPAYNENTGTVLLEALVSGLPVLTTDVCGYAEYIRSASAGVVLASPFQQAELNQALVTMLSQDRAIWKKNGLAYAQKADIYSLPEKAVDFIEI